MVPVPGGQGFARHIATLQQFVFPVTNGMTGPGALQPGLGAQTTPPFVKCSQPILCRMPLKIRLKVSTTCSEKQLPGNVRRAISRLRAISTWLNFCPK